jgi:cytochrome c-type biogenesis protein CcmE
MKARTKLLTGLALLALAATVALLTTQASSDPYREVSQVNANPVTFAGKPMSVKGQVANGSVAIVNGLVTFTLLDNSRGDPGTESIAVEYAKTLPDNFGPKNVVVSGLLVPRRDSWVLLADDIQVGCSSKY